MRAGGLLGDATAAAVGVRNTRDPVAAPACPELVGCCVPAVGATADERGERSLAETEVGADPTSRVTRGATGSPTADRTRAMTDRLRKPPGRQEPRDVPDGAADPSATSGRPAAGRGRPGPGEPKVTPNGSESPGATSASGSGVGETACDATSAATGSALDRRPGRAAAAVWEYDVAVPARFAGEPAVGPGWLDGEPALAGGTGCPAGDGGMVTPPDAAGNPGPAHRRRTVDPCVVRLGVGSTSGPPG